MAIHKYLKPIQTNEIHPTIDANYYKGQSNQRRLIEVRKNDTNPGGRSLDIKHTWDTYMIQGKIRRLTPRECERLMSWELDWTKYGINEKGETVEISDSQRYKMCGNGVVSNVVAEVVKHIICSKRK